MVAQEVDARSPSELACINAASPIELAPLSAGIITLGLEFISKSTELKQIGAN
jgi:hypothetical protein